MQEKIQGVTNPIQVNGGAGTGYSVSNTYKNDMFIQPPLVSIEEDASCPTTVIDGATYYIVQKWDNSNLFQLQNGRLYGYRILVTNYVKASGAYTIETVSNAYLKYDGVSTMLLVQAALLPKAGTINFVLALNSILRNGQPV